MTKPGNTCIETASVCQGEAGGTLDATGELLRHLEQFRKMSLDLITLLESSDYAGTEALVIDRGEVLNRIRGLLGDGRSLVQLSDEAKQQCRQMFSEIADAGRTFKNMASDKENDLLTRMQQLQKQQSNKLYTTQG